MKIHSRYVSIASILINNNKLLEWTKNKKINGILENSKNIRIIKKSKITRIIENLKNTRIIATY